MKNLLPNLLQFSDPTSFDLNVGFSIGLLNVSCPTVADVKMMFGLRDNESQWCIEAIYTIVKYIWVSKQLNLK